MTQSLLLASLMWSVAAPGPKEGPKDPSPSIVGTWIAQKLVMAGEDQKPVPLVRIEFTTEKQLLVANPQGGKPIEHTYKVDASKSPAELDWLFGGKEWQTLRGIYKIEHDTLTLCVEDGGFDSKRPDKFASATGTKTMVWTLKKVEKKKE